MAIRVYRANPTQISKKASKSKNPIVDKKHYKNIKFHQLNHYKKIFPNVSYELLSATIQKHEWTLYLMSEHFDDTNKVFDKFFTWVTHSMRLIGEEKIKQALKLGAPLYQYVQQQMLILNKANQK